MIRSFRDKHTERIFLQRRSKRIPPEIHERALIKLMMINESSKAQDTIPTPTIGMILQEEFLRPLDITPERLARELNVSSSTVLDLIHDKSRLTTPMALRLSRLFGTSERFWINLQADIDIRNRKPEMESELAAIRPIELPA